MSVRRMFDALQEGHRLTPEPWLYWCIAAFAVPLTLFGLWVALWGHIGSLTLGITFAVPLYAIAFVTVSVSKRVSRRTVFDYIATLASLICGAYLLWRSFAFESWVMGIDSFATADAVAGGVYVLLTLDLLRRCLGLAFTVFVYCLLAYLFLGQYLGGTLAHPSMPLTTFIERVIVSQNTVGIFGQAMEIVASYAFLFVLMGKFFQVMGGGQFFFDIAASMAGRRTGGVAKVATVSSALFGSVSGSPTADVMTTGSISIPMMKKMGYPPRFAASVEAVASTGGSLLPPVMGAVAFLMAELTAVSYAEVAEAALISALLYYLAVYVYAHFKSEQLGLLGMPESQIPQLRRVLKEGWFYALPLAVLIHFLMQGYGADYTAALAVLAVIAVSWWPSARARIGLRAFISGCVETCMTLAPLVAAVAAAGIVVAVLTFTGVTGKAATVIFAITDKNLFLVLIAAMIISVLLGMGMPVVATYALSAVVVAPVMIELGVPVLQAHFFLVYYAVLSFITPPIAISCYASATIAEESPMAVGWESMRVGLIAFILPLSFIYDPSLLMIGAWHEIALGTAMAAIGVVYVGAAQVGWWRGALPPWRRAILLFCGLAILVPTSTALSAMAVAVGFGAVADRLLKSWLARRQAMPAQRSDRPNDCDELPRSEESRGRTMREILRILTTIVALLGAPGMTQQALAQQAQEKPLTGAISGGIASGTFGLVGEAVMEMVRRQYPGSSLIYDQSSSAGTLSRLMKNQIKTGFAFSQVEIVAAQNAMAPFREKLSMNGVNFVARVADGMLLFAVATKEFVDKYGIKTFADIKAKKVPVRISLHRREVVTVNGQVNELLKAYGITENDIKSWGGEVYHEATAGYTKLMKNRRLDVAFSTGWHPSKDVTEMQAGMELVFIPFDKPQVDQVIKTFGLDAAVLKAGTYDFLKEDYYTTDVSFPILARSDSSDHLIYGLTKSLYYQFDYFKSVHPVFSRYDVSMLSKAGALPIHPSALRLYKEVGLVK